MAARLTLDQFLSLSGFGLIVESQSGNLTFEENPARPPERLESGAL